MKLFVTACTVKEEIRNVVIDILDQTITIEKLNDIVTGLQWHIERNNKKKAIDLLWTYSKEGITVEMCKPFINVLISEYQKAE